MTIASRKQREKDDMRALILDAAREIFLEKGYELASIRSIAEKIDYSPGTIYLYFKDKDEIFHLLHEEGFRRMLEKMSVLEHVADPFERLKAMGRVYMEFAENNKDFYQLMFIMQTPFKHEEHEDQWKMGHDTLQYLQHVVKLCQDKGHFKGKDPVLFSFTIWACLHGICALFVSDRCKAFPGMDPILLINNSFKDFISLLETA